MIVRHRRFLEQEDDMFKNKRLASLAIIALFTVMLGVGMQAADILLYIVPVLPAYIIGMVFGMLFMGVAANLLNAIFPEIFEIGTPNDEKHENF